MESVHWTEFAIPLGIIVIVLCATAASKKDKEDKPASKNITPKQRK